MIKKKRKKEKTLLSESSVRKLLSLANITPDFINEGSFSTDYDEDYRKFIEDDDFFEEDKDKGKKVGTDSDLDNVDGFVEDEDYDKLVDKFKDFADEISDELGVDVKVVSDDEDDDEDVELLNESRDRRLRKIRKKFLKENLEKEEDSYEINDAFIDEEEDLLEESLQENNKDIVENEDGSYSLSREFIDSLVNDEDMDTEETELDMDADYLDGDENTQTTIDPKLNKYDDDFEFRDDEDDDDDDDEDLLLEDEKRESRKYKVRRNLKESKIKNLKRKRAILMEKKARLEKLVRQNSLRAKRRGTKTSEISEARKSNLRKRAKRISSVKRNKKNILAERKLNALKKQKNRIIKDIRILRNR